MAEHGSKTGLDRDQIRPKPRTECVRPSPVIRSVRSNRTLLVGLYVRPGWIEPDRDQNKEKVETETGFSSIGLVHFLDTIGFTICNKKETMFYFSRSQYVSSLYSNY